jgi:tungstate transport system ATP-binding protein
MPPILPLRVDGLSYTAGGKPLLADVSFSIAGGGCTVILGPNGAGKSLLLRLCHGLLTPSAGRVAWEGPGGADAARRQAMVFQHPVMLRRSVAANVEVALKVRGLAARLRPAIVAEALARGGLTEVARQPARLLSGGEQQRLAIVRAMALAPQILFLDEPTANLDPGSVRQIEELVGKAKAKGTRLVMSTHDLAQARRLADEVMFLNRGRLVEHRPAAEFFAAPHSAEAQAFLLGDLHW